MKAPDNHRRPAALALSPLSRQGLIVSAAVLVADQVSKWWIVGTVMQPPRVIPVTPFFNLVMGWNRGVSFGLFDSESAAGAWTLSLIAIAIVSALLVWLYRADRRRVAIGIGLIVGGALGNLIDRLRYGAVADFLDFHAGGLHWPTFNIADSGITIGAVVLVADSLFVRDEKS